MFSIDEAFALVPATNSRVISVLSGGLDSSALTILLARKLGPDRVTAISFNYGQKQVLELQKAAALCATLGVEHKILDLSILGQIAAPMSANIQGSSVAMPTIHDVLGDPQPTTYVPNRNMILYSIAAAQAEVAGAELICCGLQSNDTYGYYDTTPEWVSSMNAVLEHNRKIRIRIVSPFNRLSKAEELQIVKALDAVDLLVHTLTCYNPDAEGRSCGKCPSCAERLRAFQLNQLQDPIPYQS